MKLGTMMDYASSPHLQEAPSETDMLNLREFCGKDFPDTNDKRKYYLYKSDLVSLKSQEDMARVDGLLAKFIYNKPNKLIQVNISDPVQNTKGRADYL